MVNKATTAKLPKRGVEDLGVKSFEKPRPDEDVGDEPTIEVPGPEGAQPEREDTFEAAGDQLMEGAMGVGRKAAGATIGRLFKAVGGYSVLGVGVKGVVGAAKLAERGIVATGDLVFGTEDQPGLIDVPGIVGGALKDVAIMGVEAVATRVGNTLDKVQRITLNFESAVREAGKTFAETIDQGPKMKEVEPVDYEAIRIGLEQQQRIYDLQDELSESRRREDKLRLEQAVIIRLGEGLSPEGYSDEQSLSRDLLWAAIDAQDSDPDDIDSLSKRDDLIEGPKVTIVNVNGISHGVYKAMDPRSNKFVLRSREMKAAEA